MTAWPASATDSCGVNFTCPTGVNIDVNSCYVGNPLLVTDNNGDWFTTTLAFGQRITILLTFPHATADVDTMMYAGCGGPFVTYSNGVTDTEFMDFSHLDSTSPAAYPWRVYLYSGTSNFYLMRLWKSAAFVSNDLCFFPQPAIDGDQGFSTLGATTHDAFDFHCQYAGSDTIEKDIWYTYTASCEGTLSVSLCGSSYDTRLAIYDAAVCPNVQNQALACNDDYCAYGSYLAVPTSAGTQYLIRIGGFAGDSGSGTLSIACTPSCPSDVEPSSSGNGIVDVDDLLAIINAWGACPTPCPADVHPLPAGNNLVNVDDLLAVINAWGSCP